MAKTPKTPRTRKNAAAKKDVITPDAEESEATESSADAASGGPDEDREGASSVEARPGVDDSAPVDEAEPTASTEPGSTAATESDSPEIDSDSAKPTATVESVDQEDEGGPPPGVVPAAGAEAGLSSLGYPDRTDEVTGHPDEHTESATPTAAAVVPERRSSPVFPMIVGGILAGAIGFGAAFFLLPELRPTPVPPGPDESTASLIADNTARLDVIAERVAELSDAPLPDLPDISPLSERQDAADASLADLAGGVSGIREEIASLASGLDALADRVAELEARPIPPEIPDGSSAMDAQLDAFRAELDELTERARAEVEAAQARAAEIEAEAAEASERARRRQAMAELAAALESGAPFDETLVAFDDPPADLSEAASSGVPTMTELQRDYPDAARAALAEASAAGVADEGGGNRLVSFLRRQTNARSLGPREGKDADAILSRAEAALMDGDLQAALDELGALPDAARTAMADWLDRAELRARTLAAADSLATAASN